MVELAKVEKERFVKFCSVLNLKPGWLGKTFTEGNHTFRVTGLASNPLRKHGIAVQEVNTGREYLFPTESVRAHLSDSSGKAHANLVAEAKKADLAKWKQYLENFGEMLECPKYGTTFQFKRRTYKVIGWRERGTNHVVTAFGDGNFWFFPPELVKTAVGEKK